MAFQMSLGKCSRRTRCVWCVLQPSCDRTKKRQQNPNTFNFSFESHRRCKTPQRFDVNEDGNGECNVTLFKNNSFGLFVVFSGGYGLSSTGDEKKETWSSWLSADFKNVSDTTVPGKNSEKLTSCGYVSIQLE